MSVNKDKKKYKVNKNKKNSTSFDKSILTNYSKWREDYSKESLKKEITQPKDDKSKEENKIDFKDSLINSQITEDTFCDDLVKNDNKENKKGKENKKDKENKDEKIEQKEEILTQTQRLNLIYGNVVPLYERRRRGEKKKSNNDDTHKNIENTKNSSKIKEFTQSDKEKIQKIKENNQPKKDYAEVKSSKNTKNEDSKQIDMPKIPFFLKSTFFATIALAIILVVFFGFKAYYSLSVRLPSIISGLTSKNETFYKNNMIYKNENITQDEMKSLIDVFTEDETKLNTVEKWIKEDGENLIKNPNYVSKRPIRLEKFGKIKGVFSDYKIILDPAKVKVEKSSLVETTALIDGEEQKIADQIYEVFPSKFTIFYYDNSIKLKNEALVFPNETNEVKSITYSEMTDYKLANESITLDLNSDESSFKINTRDEESILFVNDKNTNVTVKEFNTYKSTNIKKGDELKVVTKMPWGYIVSDAVTYDGSKNINVSTSLQDPKLKDIAIAKTLLVLKQFVYARGNKDLSALSVFTSDALEFTKRDVQEVINSGRKFLGGYPSVEFDLNSFEVFEYMNTFKMFIGGHLLVQETSYGTNDRLPDITKVTPEERKVGFEFIYDKDKRDWFCEAWGFTAKHITRDNIKSVDLSRDMILK